MKNILVIGDSHIKSFKNKTLLNYKFDTLKFGGASAQGLNNIQSQKKTLKKVQKFFKKNKKNYDFVILCFGEVDCNATIWFYKEKYNQTEIEALDRTLDNYFTFIQYNIASRFFKKQIILFASILPTIADDIKQTLELRSIINATQYQRTNLTKLYNMKLKKMCKKNGWHFFDINYKIENIKTRMVDKRFIINPNDHHLPEDLSYNLWSKEISSILNI